MATCGILWQFVSVFGNLYQVVATLGNLWQLWATCGIFRQFFDNFRQIVVIFGIVWQLLATWLNFLQPLAIFCSRFWQFLASFGRRIVSGATTPSVMALFAMMINQLASSNIEISLETNLWNWWRKGPWGTWAQARRPWLEPHQVNTL